MSEGTFSQVEVHASHAVSRCLPWRAGIFSLYSVLYGMEGF